MATISENDISGRYVAQVLREKPFPYLYPDGVTRMSFDAWQLCNSANINIWAKYSPLTIGGSIFPFSTHAVSHPFDCAIWEYKKNTAPADNLSLFARYNHSAIVPISGGFPTELYSNIDNMFMVTTTPDEGTNINCNDIFNTQDKYFGVAIRRVNDHSKMIWCTNANKGSNSVVVNLTGYAGYFGNGAQVEAVLFYCTSKKLLEEPDLLTDFYSIKADANVIDRKEYAIKSYSPPVSWESFRLIVEPNGGIWSYDDVTFDNLGIELKGKVAANYKMNIRIITDDGRYYTDYAMKEAVRVEAGETKRIVETGWIDLRFYNNYNLVFVQALNANDNNKLIAEIPVMRMIEHQS